jgi:DNA polymerase V
MNVIYEDSKELFKSHKSNDNHQLELFVDYDTIEDQQKQSVEELKKERRMQETIIDIKKKFGNNAILKGLSFQDGATAKDRNRQIGGHKA